MEVVGRAVVAVAMREVVAVAMRAVVAVAMYPIVITCGLVTRATATIKIDTMVKIGHTIDPNGQNDPITTNAIDTVAAQATVAIAVEAAHTVATMIIIRSISDHGIKPIGKLLQWKHALESLYS